MFSKPEHDLQSILLSQLSRETTRDECEPQLKLCTEQRFCIFFPIHVLVKVQKHCIDQDVYRRLSICQVLTLGVDWFGMVCYCYFLVVIGLFQYFK